MKICPNCGQQSPDDTVFCPNCGQRVPDQPAPSRTGGFCPNCGAPQPAGTAFCANCGFSLAAPAQPQTQAPVQPQAAPAQKGGGAKKAVIAVVVVALVVAIGAGGYLLVSRLLGGGSGVGLFASEEERFVGYQRAVLADPMMDVMERLLDACSGGISTDLTIRVSAEGSAIPDELADTLENSSVLLRLNLDRDSLLADAGLVLMGSPVISGMFTYDKGVAGFCLPELDKNYYTADLTQLAEALFGMDLDLGNMVLPNISGKDLRALAESYLDIVTGIVSQDNLEVEKNQSFRLPQLRESYTGTVYTFKPRPKDVEKMLLDLAGQLKKDKQLRQLLLETFDSGLFAALLTTPGFELENAFDDAIAELADALEDSAADIADWVEDTDLTWTLYMEGGEIRMITITMDVGHGNTSSIVYERAGSASKGLTVALYVMATRNGGEEENIYYLFENSCTRKGSTLTGELELIRYPDTILESRYSLKYETDTGNLSPLGIPAGSYRLEVDVSAGWNSSGERTVETMALSFEVSEARNGSYDHVYTIPGESLDLVAGSSQGYDYIRLTVNATDRCTAKAPTDKAVDITDYDEDELEDLFMGLFYEAQRQMYGILGDLQRVTGAAGDSLLSAPAR